MGQSKYIIVYSEKEFKHIILSVHIENMILNPFGQDHSAKINRFPWGALGPRFQGGGAFKVVKILFAAYQI